MKVLLAVNTRDADYFKVTHPELADAYVALIGTGRSYEGLRVTEAYATPWALSEGFGKIYEVLRHSSLLMGRKEIAAKIL